MERWRSSFLSGVIPRPLSLILFPEHLPMIAKIATGEVEDMTKNDGKNAAAAALGGIYEVVGP